MDKIVPRVFSKALFLVAGRSKGFALFVLLGVQSENLFASNSNNFGNETLYNTDSISNASSQGNANLNSTGVHLSIKTAAKDNLSAESKIIPPYNDENDFDTNSSLAIKSLETAARHGSVSAERRLGMMLLSDTGDETNIQEGGMWLTKAANANDVLAQFALGTKYIDGLGFPKDHTNAFHWILLAAQHDLSNAQNQVGLMYMTGDGVSQNIQVGREWFEKAAKHGNADALYNLGRTYIEGISVKRDVAMGGNFLAQSAMRGNMVAEAYLGTLYLAGNEVPKNIAFGLRLLKNAAGSGNAQAQVNYGNFLMTGRLPDYTIAFEWIHLAAQQGFPQAEFEMGMMYKEGLGVKQDNIEALFWFDLAVTNGIDKAIAQKVVVQASLNAGQLTEASEKASTFKIQKVNNIPNTDDETLSTPLNDDGTVAVRLFSSTNNFVIDTGAEIGCIDSGFLSKLGNKVANTTVYGAYAPVENVPIFPGPDIWIENRPLNISWVECLNLQEISKLNQKPIGGILGMDFLKKKVIYFDQEKRTVNFGNFVPEEIRRTCQPVQIQAIPGHDDLFEVEAQINGRTLNMLIDSGDSGEINFNDQDRREIFAGKSVQTNASTFAGMGDPQGRNGYLFNQQIISIGTNYFSNLTATFVEGRTYSSIGRPFILKHFAALDFPNKLIYVSLKK